MSQDRPSINRWRALAASALLVLLTAVPIDARAGTATLEERSLMFRGVADGDVTGFALAVGDFDGDGTDDLAIGAPCSAASATAAGAVHILYGPLTEGRSLADADATLLGAAAGDFLGEGLAVADLDGDGADELVTSSPGPFVGAGPAGDACFATPVQSGTNRPGETYVLRGGERRSGTAVARDEADAVLTGLSPADFFGLGVAGTGDVDGDGEADLLAGAHGPGSLPSGGGSAFLFTQPLEGQISAAQATTQLFGEAPADLAGVSLASGDLDGDGHVDLFVGAPGHEFSVERAGRVYVLHDTPSGPRSLTAADAVLEGAAPQDFTGRSMAVGQLVGGPAVDIAVGAPGSNTVYLVEGGERLSGSVALTDASHRIEGETGGVGYALAVADLNGDGTDGLVVGRPGIGLPDDGGEVAIFNDIHGELTLDQASDRYLGVPGDDVGYALAAGDLTGDGIDDLVAGAVGLDHGGPGAAYVVPGRPQRGRSGEVMPPTSPGQGVPPRGPAPVESAGSEDAASGPSLPSTGGGAGSGALALLAGLVASRRRSDVWRSRRNASHPGSGSGTKIACKKRVGLDIS